MDDKQENPQSQPRRPREASAPNYALLQGFHMVGWREHQVLITEGHYRCGDCCRADTLETNAAHTRQR